MVCMYVYPLHTAAMCRPIRPGRLRTSTLVLDGTLLDCNSIYN